MEHAASDGNQIDEEEHILYLVSDAPVHEQEGPVSSNLIDVGVFFKSCNPYESLVAIQITVMLQSILFFIHVFFSRYVFRKL